MAVEFGEDTSFIIPVTCLLVLEMICGAVSSLSVVLIYWKRRQVRSVANLFITHLAILDCAICCLSIPFTIVLLAFKPVHTGILCCGHESITSSLRNASFLTLIVICQDRYISVTSPFRVRFNSVKATRVLIILWLFSLLSLGVPFVEWFRLSDTLHSLPCNHWFTNSSHTLYFRLYYLPAFLICCAIILPSYWKISKAAMSRVHIAQSVVVRASISMVPNINPIFSRSNGGSYLRQREMRIAKMTGAIICTVCVLWLPYMILTFSMFFLEPSHLLSQLEFVFLVFGYLTCILNPLLYAFSKQKFRMAFFRVLPICKQVAGEND